MTSDNNETATVTPAKRPRTSLPESDIGTQNSSEEKTPLGGNAGSAALSSDGEINFPNPARTLDPPPPPLTIDSAYVRPPNKPNALKALKGTRLESLRALLAPLPEQFITKIVALSRATLDLAQKIKQREASAAHFEQPVVVRD